MPVLWKFLSKGMLSYFKKSLKYKVSYLDAINLIRCSANRQKKKRVANNKTAKRATLKIKCHLN